MRIMAVSDRIVEHLYSSDVQSRHGQVDLLIGCGDLPFYYLEFLISALDARMVYVRGNHDIGPQYTADGRVLTEVPGGLDVHRRVVEVNGLLIAGLEGSIRYRPRAPYMYSEQEMRWNAWNLIPRLMMNKIRHGRALDILVTHSPPAGIHDLRDPAHRGFGVLRSLIRRFRPRYLLHGHIHVYRNDVPKVTKFLDTTVINVYPYRVFEYGDL
jgi:Icc-related predicted phosphoesterase